MFVFIQTVWEENNKFDENNKFGLSHAKCVVLLSLDFKRLYLSKLYGKKITSFVCTFTVNLV